MGRKRKDTPETIDKLLEAIETGATVESAANSAGVGLSTVYDWANSNPVFSERLKSAQETRDTYGRELAIHTIIQAMRQGVWQAGAWWLERTNPEKFSQKQRLDHTSKGEQIQGFEITIVDSQTTISEN